jgi:hypothetical protein
MLIDSAGRLGTVPDTELTPLALRNLRNLLNLWIASAFSERPRCQSGQEFNPQLTQIKEPNS